MITPHCLMIPSVKFLPWFLCCYSPCLPDDLEMLHILTKTEYIYVFKKNTNLNPYMTEKINGLIFY